MWQFVGYESTRRLDRNVWAWVRIVCVRNVHGYETTGKLYTPGWREALWELCLAQEHNCLVYVGKLCNAPWSLHSLLHMVNLYCGMCHLIWVSLKWDLAANKSKVQFKYRLSFLVIIFQDSAFGFDLTFYQKYLSNVCRHWGRELLQSAARMSHTESAGTGLLYIQVSQCQPCHSDK